MLYTVSITSATTSIRHECSHIVSALDLVQRISRNRVRTIDLITDVAQLGEWLECIDDTWYRVVACRVH